MLILQLVTMTTVHTCVSGTTKLGTTCRRALKVHWMLLFVCSSLITRFTLNKSSKTYIHNAKKRILTYHCLRLDVSVYRKDTINANELRCNKRYYNHCTCNKSILSRAIHFAQQFSSFWTEKFSHILCHNYKQKSNQLIIITVPTRNFEAHGTSKMFLKFLCVLLYLYSNPYPKLYANPCRKPYPNPYPSPYPNPYPNPHPNP